MKKVSLEKRAIFSFFLMMVFFMTCVLRVAVIAKGNYAQMQTEQSSYRITVSRPRGTIYDCNMVPITNSTKKTVAAVSPTPRAITGISSLVDNETFLNIKEELSKGKPVVVTTNEESECDGISFADVHIHNSSDTFAPHIIGYTDNSGHGVSGIEGAYDSILYSQETLDAVFTINGKGGVLEGVAPYFENNILGTNNCVITTLDVNIQNIAQISSKGINKGAIVIADAKNSKIRGLVSLPTFDMTNLQESLDNTDSPLINRCLLSYSVGSVFKPCVAAVAMDNKKSDFLFNCEGRTKIVDRFFNCHKRAGHGLLDLKHALAFSCNCYFYNFAIQIGGDKVYNTASALNFGESIKIGENLKTAKGNITAKNLLSNDATLANLSIGQGDVALSPVSMLTLYCAIANDGSYYLPSVIESTVKNGEKSEYNIGKPTKVMEKETAEKLRDYLKSVVTEGTGTEAKCENVEVAGKTATAQTGRFNEKNIEITNSWFCGFFPADNPKYVVIVMSEGQSQRSTASVFSEIAQKITELEENI